jgi:hypothetical protein
MLNLDIPNRPFASEPITGLMLPDGIFETTIGQQSINIHVRNTGAAAIPSASVYVESVDDPGIVITPLTHVMPASGSGVNHLFTWNANFSGATPGVHRISFIVTTAAERRRIIKKIFVTKVGFDASTGTFSAETPEGKIGIRFHDFVQPKTRGCGCACKPEDQQPPTHQINLLDYLKRGSEKRTDFNFCLPQYLLRRFSVEITATPPFPGQYGDLPFQDPWWKVLLCIIAVILLIAAAIAEAVDGTGSIAVGTGGGGGSGGTGTPCCGVSASGGGTSYIAAGLVAAAAAAATAAGLSDVRDPIRKGQDKTVPAPGAFTLSEELTVELSYGEPIALGRPFTVGAKWEYRRITTAGVLTYSTSESNANIHTLSRYDIVAKDVVLAYRKERWTVEASFFDEDGKQFFGSRLFVQCFLCGPAGQWRRFVLQDNGRQGDRQSSDGVFTGYTTFGGHDRGLWTYFVIAQDVNSAQPDMKPEEAAQIIGGFVRTHQLTITLGGGECALIPDGHVNVIT